jgi:hypothetical protein
VGDDEYATVVLLNELVVTDDLDILARHRANASAPVADTEAVQSSLESDHARVDELPANGGGMPLADTAAGGTELTARTRSVV